MAFVPNIGHQIIIEPSEGFKKLGRMDLWSKHLPAMLRKIGLAVQHEIIVELTKAGFKNPTGTIEKSIKVDVNVGESSVIIYADKQVAPYAIYQERGVHRHQMTYLTRATRAIPLGFANVKGTIFRKATPKSMSEGKWVHPGYVGKWFFDKGVKSAFEKIQQSTKELLLSIQGD
jgi:hypothetical protein